MNFWRQSKYYLSIPKTWLQLTCHNSWGILNVLDLIWLRPVPGGLIDENHPFCTGLDPATGQPIWRSNLLFRTEPKTPWPGKLPPDPDDQILAKTGDHLRR